MLSSLRSSSLLKGHFLRPRSQPEYSRRESCVGANKSLSTNSGSSRLPFPNDQSSNTKIHQRRNVFKVNNYRSYHIQSYSIDQQLGSLLREACIKCFPDLKVTEKTLGLSTSPIGDYRSSISFQISHLLKKKPQEVAQNLAQEMMASKLPFRNLIEKVELTGAGFITITLSSGWLCNQSVHQKSFEILNNTGCVSYEELKAVPKRRKIIIDHGSPNMSKEFHVGHLRSIMIGDCLSRVLKHQGHDVETASHVGDFGTPMGLVIAQAIRSGRLWASVEQFKNPPAEIAYPSPSELSELYTEAKKQQKTDTELVEFTTKCVAEIQKLDKAAADPHILHVYTIICDASRRGFDEVYKRLEVSIPEKGESWYGPLIPETIQELKDKNLLTESDGAAVCKLDSWKAPLIVEKSDKSWLYGTTDLACLRYRVQHYDELLYVVDFTQNQHFEQVFEVGRKAGWYDPQLKRVEHVHFGVVQGSNGLKLSSRDGTPMTLKGLLDEAIVETRRALIAAKSLVRSDRQDQDIEPTSQDERLAEPVRFGTLTHGSEESSELASKSVSPAALALAEENAATVAFNAIKYFELAQTRTANYIFSFQSMLSFKGNTSFYIIYAYARIHTLYRRAAEQNVEVPELANDASPQLSAEEIEAVTSRERELALKILQFPDIVRQVEQSLMPHLLSAHVFQTAQKFHSFYENCRVIGSPNQKFRLMLCKSTEQVLSKGLELLNVQTVNRV